jgi:hypothetical protein
MQSDNPPDADAERLERIRLKFPAETRWDTQYDRDVRFLLEQIDARDAAVREAREDCAQLAKAKALQQIDLREARDRIAALERVAKAARQLSDLPRITSDTELSGPGYASRYIRCEYKLREALAACDAAEPDEWRPDRPGWYWVMRSFEEGVWVPAQWIIIDDVRAWAGYAHPEEIVDIGPCIPPPPAPREGDGK